MTDPNSQAWAELDMSTLVFLDEEHLSAFDLDSLPPPGTSTSSLTVEVEPEILDELAHDARATGRTIPQVIQDRLHRGLADLAHRPARLTDPDQLVSKEN